MARPIKPYSISSTRANGVVWYYRLQGWSNYQSTGIEVERRNGEPTKRSQQRAEDYAARQWHNAALVASRGETIAEVMADAYRWTDADQAPECGYLRQILTDSGGTGYKYETAKNNRSRVDRFILQDEIARAPADSPPQVWQQWKQRLVDRGNRDGFGARTTNMTIDHARAFFQWLADTGQMPHNPIAGVRSIRDEADEKGIFTAEELRAMFAHPQWWGYPGRAKQQEKNGAYTYAAPVLIASTLCRPFEIFSIRWRDVDTDTLTIPLQKKVRGKGDKGRRVPLTESARAALDALTRGGPDDLVFGTRTRHFYDQRFAAMMVASGFPADDPDGRGRTPYSLKHSMYTYLIDEGADPVTVAELAGHSRRAIGARSLTATQEHYKRASLERLRVLVPLIDGVMSREQGGNIIAFHAG